MSWPPGWSMLFALSTLDMMRNAVPSGLETIAGSNSDEVWLV